MFSVMYFRERNYVNSALCLAVHSYGVTVCHVAALHHTFHKAYSTLLATQVSSYWITGVSFQLIFSFAHPARFEKLIGSYLLELSEWRKYIGVGF